LPLGIPMLDIATPPHFGTDTIVADIVMAITVHVFNHTGKLE
jgi:hypothetical protein